MLVVLFMAGAACRADGSDGNDAVRPPGGGAGQAGVDAGAGVTSTSGKVTAATTKTKDDTVSIPSDLLFAFDSAELSPDAERLLAGALDLAVRLPKATIAIDGHTDAVGNASYNEELSRRRAASVAAWLQVHGVDAKRMTARGLGSEHPVADNATPEGQQMNRRVEIVVRSKT